MMRLLRHISSSPSGSRNSGSIHAGTFFTLALGQDARANGFCTTCGFVIILTTRGIAVSIPEECSLFHKDAWCNPVGHRRTLTVVRQLHVADHANRLRFAAL